MDNRDFWPYIRVAKLPEFNPAFISSSSSLSSSQSKSLFIWLFKNFRSLYRYFYVHLHDFILSSIFGYLTLNEKLYIAVHQNDFYKARQLLSRGALPNFLPVDCKSILTHLLRTNAKVKNYLVDRTLLASIDANDSMLYMAVANNSFNLVKELIDYHDYGQKGQHTEVVSLCLAVKRNYVNIVGYLIDYGRINPNDCVQSNCKHCKTHSIDMQTYQFPLYHACRDNHIKLVKYLIESKHCDINQLTTTYETCLHGAILGAIENCFDTSSNHEARYHIVQYLLSCKDCTPNRGVNPLCISLAYDNIYDYTNLLLQNNCDVNRLGWNVQETTKTNPGRNNYSLESLDHPLNICLSHLCEAKKTRTVADDSCQKQYALKFIKRQSNIYAMYDYRLSYPLLLAVQTGDPSLVEEILVYGESQINFDIIEPLVCACERSDYTIVKILVDFGFKPNTIMFNRTKTISNDTSMMTVGIVDFLENLNRYCTISSQSLISMHPSLKSRYDNNFRSYMNSEQPTTPFSALSLRSPWIFHPDKYEATVKTLENLFSSVSIDFSILPNRYALHHALVNEHLPLVYFCLQNFCPIILLHNTIEFKYVDSKNHFSYTLLNIIAACCRLTSDNQIKRVLFNAFAKGILRLHTLSHSSAKASVLVYIKLWLSDEDFIYDSILLEHLLSLPYVDEIIQANDKKQLCLLFGEHYQYFMEGKSRLKPIYKLKHLCRLKIRHYGEVYCQRKQTNMLKIFEYFDCFPTSLKAYLFYTRSKFVKFNSSKSLIDYLINSTPWNEIKWL